MSQERAWVRSGVLNCGRRDIPTSGSFEPPLSIAPGAFSFGGSVPILRRARPDISRPEEGSPGDLAGPTLRPTLGGGIETDDADYTGMVLSDFEDSLQGGYFVTEVCPEFHDPSEATLTRSEYEASRN